MVSRKLRLSIGLMLISPLPILAAIRVAEDVGWRKLGEMVGLAGLLLVGMALILSALVSYSVW